MECAGKRLIHLPKTQDIFFYNLSDIHLGNKACAKKKLYETIDEIKKTKFAYWFATGDLGEYISARDKRHDFSSMDDEIFDSPEKIGNMGGTIVDSLVELLEPIKDKCMGIGIGNHEWSYAVANNQESIHRSLCNRLNATYIGYSAFLDTNIKVANRTETRTIRHFLSHGSGGAATPGGKLNTIMKYINQFDADIYWVGHLHDSLAYKVPIVGADRKCNYLMAKIKLGIMSGSFFRTYAQGVTTYSERKGYRPTYLGAAKVRVAIRLSEGLFTAEPFAEI